MDPERETRIRGELAGLRQRVSILATAADKIDKECQQLIGTIEALERLAGPATLAPFAPKPLMKGQTNRDNEAMVRAVVGEDTSVTIEQVLVGVAHHFNAHIQQQRAQAILIKLGFSADAAGEVYTR